MSPYIFASGLLRCGFFFCSAAAFIILLKLLLPEKKAAPSASFSVAAFFRLPWQAKHDFTVLLIPALFLSIVSVILFKAFIACDFSVEYVAQYADRTLPLFYRITAFWAGQAGSMLFWALAVGLSGVFFVKNAAYKNLRPRTRLYFCLFFLSIMAFFNFLLTVWTNPFTLLDSIPADGGGLNPLLQNPGMIFHPPLLLLGYGGFTAPACLALAQSTGDGHAGHGAKAEEPWTETARPHILGSWSLLTAGIVLGAWWAYMELGWGGYWAWDPVENASLLPWFAASAYIHTAIIGRRGGKLRRVNVFLICLTTASAFFATYLVRSGVVQSLHAFGDNGIGAPLLIFTLFFLYVATAAALLLPPSATALDDMLSREGLILFVAWLLLAVAAIILIATLWPVIINALRDVSAYLPDRISAKLPQKPMGLDAAFYNGACLPLLAMFSILLVFCPGRRWKSEAKGGAFLHPRLLALTLVLGGLAGAVLWTAGIRHPVALPAAACSIAGICGIILHFAANRSRLSNRRLLAAHGTHAGLLMIILGVAISGPYQQKYILELGRRDSGSAGNYRVVVNELYEGESRIGPDGQPGYRFVEAELHVFAKNGEPIGVLSPQRRLYAKFDRQSYAEVSTIFSPGNEIYAVLLGIDENTQAASLALNINPLVNWLWFGGTLLCVFPLIGLARGKRRLRPENSGAEKNASEPAPGV